MEVEAYIGEEDLASHARFGRTARNSVMFGPPGIAYVYLVYGMHECLNVVTEPAGRPAAVLIRAVAPVLGIESMRAARLARALRLARSDAARELVTARITALPRERLAAGPGLVCAAFEIDRRRIGTDLLDSRSELRIEQGTTQGPITETPRVGIEYAPEPWRSAPWRFLESPPAISRATPRGKRA